MLNPNKQDLGRVSNEILRRIVTKIKHKTKLNLWIDTKDVNEWFTGIPDKQETSFIQIDVEKMYPSITLKTLEKPIRERKKE